MKRAAQIVSKNDTLTDIEDLRKEQVTYIKEMRKAEDAPVDTMGCHKLADPLAPPEVYRFQVLLSLMLSSQTKDQITASAIMRLREHGCDADSMIKIPRPELEKLLFPVGFYKRKAGYIQEAAQSIKTNFKGDIPKTLEDNLHGNLFPEIVSSAHSGVLRLCSLSGVGPKMGHLVMQVAWGKVEGIAVDTHVHRIVNRLGWMITNTPEETRIKLQNMLPREEWDKINPLLVGFGQQICLPVKPHCDTCLCNQICPSSTYKKKMNGKEPKTKSPRMKTEPIKAELDESSEIKTELSESSNIKIEQGESPKVELELIDSPKVKSEPSEPRKAEKKKPKAEEDLKRDTAMKEEVPKKRTYRRKK